jgi:membrane fusion protein, heavy metal efflux system
MNTQIPKLRHLLLMSILVAMTAGCGAKKADSPEEHEPTEQKVEHPGEEGAIHLTPEESQRAGIALKEVVKETVLDQLILTANIVANQDRLAHVTPRVEGKLSKVIANLGDTVSSGSPLAEIDSIQMGEARAQYRSAQSELSLAKANFERIDRLFKEEVVPQKQWLESKSAYERATFAARAESERLRMYGGLAQQNGSTYIVTAPFKGTVIEKNAVIGELAKPADIIFTIADISTVWIEANVAENELSKIAIGKEATVSVTAYPGEEFKGKVGYISNTVDRDTRTVKARIELPNPEGKLRIDMYARASLSMSGSKDVMIVPKEAVVIIQGQDTVYVTKNDAYEARAVKLGDRLTDSVVVTSGLSAGEQVVIKGAYALKSRQLKSQISDEH